MPRWAVWAGKYEHVKGQVYWKDRFRESVIRLFPWGISIYSSRLPRFKDTTAGRHNNPSLQLRLPRETDSWVLSGSSLSCAITIGSERHTFFRQSLHYCWPMRGWSSIMWVLPGMPFHVQKWTPGFHLARFLWITAPNQCAAEIHGVTHEPEV